MEEDERVRGIIAAATIILVLPEITPHWRETGAWIAPGKYNVCGTMYMVACANVLHWAGHEYLGVCLAQHLWDRETSCE